MDKPLPIISPVPWTDDDREIICRFAASSRDARVNSRTLNMWGRAYLDTDRADFEEMRARVVLRVILTAAGGDNTGGVP
jgi:hypothetical protein